MEFERVFEKPIPHTIAGVGFGSVGLDVDGFLLALDSTNPVLDDAMQEDWMLYLHDIAVKAVKAHNENLFKPKIDKYVAKSLMQKGIRRRDWQAASYGAFALMAMGARADAVRRLHIIAMEDVGNGDPQAAALAQMLLQSTAVRKEMGDLETVLMATRVLTMAWKSRDCTDLVCWPNYEPNWAMMTDGLKLAKPDDLQSIALGSGHTLFERIAAMTCLNNSEKLEVASELKCSPSTIYAYEMSAKKSGFSFRHVAPFAALMTQKPVMRADVFPIFNDKVHGIQAAAYDRYTSRGKSAILIFSKLAELKRWFLDHPHVERAEAIMEAVFYVEGGLISPRIVYDQSMDLYWSTLEAMLKKQGFESLDEGLELYDLVLQFLPRLNRLRISTGTDRPHDKGVL